MDILNILALSSSGITSAAGEIPASTAYSLKSLSHTPFTVPIKLSFILFASSVFLFFNKSILILSFNSAAARFVNVVAINFSGETPSSITLTILEVRLYVLPEPALALISSIFFIVLLPLFHKGNQNHKKHMEVFDKASPQLGS